MKKRILILLIMFLSITFFKCEDDDTILGPIPDGTYFITSFDGQGNKLVEGEFIIKHSDSKIFTGTWDFKAVGNLDNPRPQVGTGELVGEIRDNDEVFIDLNPGWADNNATLTGKFTNGTFRGEWSWVGFAGFPEKGTFTASEK